VHVGVVASIDKDAQFDVRVVALQIEEVREGGSLAVEARLRGQLSLAAFHSTQHLLILPIHLQCMPMARISVSVPIARLQRVVDSGY